ncbi:MAG: biotin/lipoyl-binding protein [Acidipila sp.]|nr:biotin/lipoyl-binding protein [Acidipila sp.]
MSPRATLAIIGVSFLFVLLPFLAWQASWFGRPLSDAQLTHSLSDADHPRNAQHGLVQLGERIDRHEPGTARWYPQVVALARYPEKQVRLTAAWVMGRDNTSQEFHSALLAMLADSDPMVRANAALALVRFADSSGRAQIHSLLELQVIAAPQSGTLNTRLKVADIVRPGTLLAHISRNVSGNNPGGQNQSAGSNQGGKGSTASATNSDAIGKNEKIEVRSDVPGRVERWLVADGASVTAGQPLLELAPSPDVAWEALRALYLIGQQEDLAVVQNFTRASGDMPRGVQQQAALTLEAIRARSGS